MLQLSSLNCTCLIRLHLIEAYGDLPQSLVQLLEDKRLEVKDVYLGTELQTKSFA